MLPAVLARPIRWVARQSLRFATGVLALALSLGQAHTPTAQQPTSDPVATQAPATASASPSDSLTDTVEPVAAGSITAQSADATAGHIRQDDVVAGSEFAIASGPHRERLEQAALAGAVSPWHLRSTSNPSQIGQRAPPGR